MSSLHEVKTIYIDLDPYLSTTLPTTEVRDIVLTITFKLRFSIGNLCEVRCHHQKLCRRCKICSTCAIKKLTGIK